MEPVIVQFEDPVRQHMQKFLVTETPKMFNIVVPGTTGSEATDTDPAVAGTAAKTWSFPRDVLASIFPHGRDDMPALFDFIQASWTFAKHAKADGGDALMKPSEQQTKLSMVCAKFGASLLEVLDVDTFRQFRELQLTVDGRTTVGAVKAGEKAAAKAVKDAEREADKAAKKKKRDEENAAKKVAAKKIKDAEKAAKPKDEAKVKTEKPKAPSKAERQAALNKATAPVVAKPAKPLSKKAQAELDKVAAEEAAAKAAYDAERAKQNEGINESWPASEAWNDETKPTADDLLEG